MVIQDLSTFWFRKLMHRDIPWGSQSSESGCQWSLSSSGSLNMLFFLTGKHFSAFGNIYLSRFSWNITSVDWPFQMLRHALVPPSLSPLSKHGHSQMYHGDFLLMHVSVQQRRFLEADPPTECLLNRCFLNKWNIKTGVHACSVAQLCPTLRNFMDSSPPGSSVRGILLARIRKWVATPSSRDLLKPGSNSRLLHCRWTLWLSHGGTPKDRHEVIDIVTFILWSSVFPATKSASDPSASQLYKAQTS